MAENSCYLGTLRVNFAAALVLENMIYRDKSLKKRNSL